MSSSRSPVFGRSPTHVVGERPHAERDALGPLDARSGAPLLGEHSEDELHRMGVDAATVGHLVEPGVIGVTRGTGG